MDTIQKKGKPVNLRAGHSKNHPSFLKVHDRLDVSILPDHHHKGTKLEEVRYRQLDYLEEDFMYVIKAAASRIFCHNPTVACNLFQRVDRVDRTKMKDFRQIMRQFGVETDFLNKTEENTWPADFFLNLSEGLLLAKVVDQNYGDGHCIFIDAGRNFIIDASNAK